MRDLDQSEPNRPHARRRQVRDLEALGTARKRRVHVCEERDNTLAVLRDGIDGLEPLRVQTTLPAEFFGDSAVAAIFTDAAGERVFVSNRGHDSLAVFDLRHDPPRRGGRCRPPTRAGRARRAPRRRSRRP